MNIPSKIGTAALILLTACAHHPRVLSIHLGDYADSQPTDRIRIAMPSGEALYAEIDPVLEDRDFISARYGVGADGLPQVTLCFARQGRKRFQRVVQANVGRRLAFLIHGRLLFAPIIESTDVPECSTISGHVSQEDADALQRALNRAG